MEARNMTISKKIEAFMTRSSWIRKMFEEGARLKAEHGPENVFDFSLGNPNLEPPGEFNEILEKIVRENGGHGYMPQAGYPYVREKVAEYISRDQGVAVTANDVIMTCGAAGALNIILKAVLDPGDEVLSPRPCFVEYYFYTDNHGGIFKTVPTRDDFSLDLEAMAAAVTDKTKVLLINSPNNPTGQVYSRESLDALGRLLREKSAQFEKTIYLISDEPYRKIVYDDVPIPCIFDSYANSIMATSYSKDISIPGERIGFAVVNPEAEYRSDLMNAMALTNRIMGFVNAPALMQRVVAEMQGASVDVSRYKRKRDLLCDGLRDCGYDFIIPPGAFYLFPKTPVADDVAFVRTLQEELILVVPGSGFMGEGHFRIAFCVEDDTIVNAMPGFKRVMDGYK
jgi:aspartate aminotransferase